MVSAIVITKDEERIIKVCLESIKWVDEIIVIDWNSNAETLEIAKKYTNNIYKYKGNDFSEARNLGMEKAKGEWVLYIDADERVLQSLKDELIEISKSSKKSAYAVSRINIIFGQRVNYGPYEKDWMIRFFKKEDFETWVGKVHEYGKFKGELSYTQNSLLHLTHRDLDHFILKSLSWSKVDAKLRFESGHPKMTKWRFLRILITEFYHQLVARKGLFAGTVGIIDSILQVFFFYMTYVRLWQMQQPKALDQVYQELDKKLLETGFDYR